MPPTHLSYTDFHKDCFCLQHYIFDKTPIKKFETKIINKSRLVTTFNLKVFDKDDYLWLLVAIYHRVSNEAANIKDDFDKKMKSTISNYTRKFKDKIYNLFTIDDIYNRYIEYRKRNNIR